MTITHITDRERQLQDQVVELRAELEREYVDHRQTVNDAAFVLSENRKLLAKLEELRADRDSLHDALAALVPVVEAINGDLSTAAWHSLEDARHVLGEQRTAIPLKQP